MDANKMTPLMEIPLGGYIEACLKELVDYLKRKPQERSEDRFNWFIEELTRIRKQLKHLSVYTEDIQNI